ncbi:hypothetical protein E2C06_22955 [Dankookia rubra]|uniref:Amine oxidase domain-containing protein n=1 Tax=Dankookia rubra TaxID=1442381 RepID=A0A4R5QBQ8_9PROT|nr:FAD-dependent oxidoreductase [Dankookia rubra]TDH60276.1 hypothetical protein E2C06_22955 [Dankookia rubra]
MRLAGGTGALVRALAAGLPGDAIRLGAQVTRVALEDAGVRLSLRGSENGEDATLLKDWSANPLTTAAEDRRGDTHLLPRQGSWVTGA